MRRTKKVNTKEAAILAELGCHTGTENYYSYRIPLTKRMIGVYTDGVKHMAELCGAYWLIDVVFSWQYGQRLAEPFQTWKLRRRGEGGILTATDGNGNKLATQKIPYSDFPMNKIKLFLAAGEVGGNPTKVLMLPSEY